MSLEEQAKAQVVKLVDELGLAWGADGLSEKAAGVVVDLVHGLQGPGDYVRLVQALFVPADRPDARERESIKAIRGAIRNRSETLGGGADGVLWCQVLAGAALVVDPERVDGRGQTAFQAAYIGFTSVSKETKRLATEVEQAVVYADDVSVPTSVDSALNETAMPTDRGDRIWTGVKDRMSQVDLETLALTDSRGGRISSEPLRDMLDHVCTAIKLLNSTTASNHHLHSEQIEWLDSSLRQRAERRLSSQLRESNALWWGQALYSKRRRASYRDLDASALPWLMADDLLDAIGPSTDEAVTAWYTETLRRLWPDIDAERPWVEHLRALREGLSLASPEPLPAGLLELIQKEATALPVTRLLPRVAGDSPEKIADLSGLESGPVKGVVVARQLFRERSLARWFAEESG